MFRERATDMYRLACIDVNSGFIYENIKWPASHYHSWNIRFIRRYSLTSISCCLSSGGRSGFGGGSRMAGFAEVFPWFIWEMVCKLQCILLEYRMSICSIWSLEREDRAGIDFDS